MTATLSQSDADRFSIFIDAVIESPRFNFSAFCKAAKITADQAIRWVARPDIAAALESCIILITAAARIRHTILDTNAMGALGELLRTSTNEIEVRRAATTIISRHRADLRSSRATVLGGTGLPTGVLESASRATDPSSDQCESSSLTSELSNLKSGTCASSDSSAQCLVPSALPLVPLLSTQNSALSTSPVDPLLQLKLIADTLRLRNEPVPREPRSAKSILNRAGATTAMSRDRPR